MTSIRWVATTSKWDSLLARLRALYWVAIRRHETELCQHCGRPVHVVYHAPDWIWEKATGRSRSPGGESAGGVLCIPCLDDFAAAAGLPYLRWTCSITDEVMVG